jgi:hypothetical protein
MAGVSKYTESDRAAVYFSLQVNSGNVKRSARETGYPESTVRLWKKEFSEKGPPAADAVEAVASDFVADGERIRNKALMRAEKMIDDVDSNLKLAELTAISGMLTDKLNVAQGLATKRVEHTHTLPTADEARELLRGFADEMRQLASERDAEIIDAEVIEQRALPAVT